MKDSMKVWIALGLGVVAGGITGFYLNSDEGRTRRKKAAKTMKKQAQQASEKMSELVDQAKTSIHDATEQALNYISKATEDDSDGSFKKGVSSARSKAESVEKSIAQNTN
jgi:gas vesicle protein